MKPRAMLALIFHPTMGRKSLCLAVMLMAMASLSSGCAALLAAMRNRAVYYEEGVQGVTVNLTSPMQHPSGGSLGNRTFTVHRGDSRETVISSCGPPGITLGSNIWVYWNCAPAEAAARRAGYDTLAVVFLNNQVQDIRLVNGQALRIYMERNLPQMRNLE